MSNVLTDVTPLQDMILTAGEVATELRCSKAQVHRLINGDVKGSGSKQSRRNPTTHQCSENTGNKTVAIWGFRSKCGLPILPAKVETIHARHNRRSHSVPFDRAVGKTAYRQFRT